MFNFLVRLSSLLLVCEVSKRISLWYSHIGLIYGNN